MKAYSTKTIHIEMTEDEASELIKALTGTRVQIVRNLIEVLDFGLES